MDEYCLIIGRFQPYHKGHQALVQKLLDEGENVCIGVMKTPLDKNNPHSLAKRANKIREIYRNDSRVVVWLLPKIKQVCYGRNVGYKIRRIHHDKEHISATKIREKFPDGIYDKATQFIPREWLL